MLFAIIILRVSISNTGCLIILENIQLTILLKFNRNI